MLQQEVINTDAGGNIGLAGSGSETQPWGIYFQVASKLWFSVKYFVAFNLELNETNIKETTII